MNRNECIDFVLKALINNTERTSENVYKQCKEVCKQNGYVGECFIQIWNNAVKKHEIYLGVKP